jgi:hypothetical protein
MHVPREKGAKDEEQGILQRIGEINSRWREKYWGNQERHLQSEEGIEANRKAYCKKGIIFDSSSRLSRLSCPWNTRTW